MPTGTPVQILCREGASVDQPRNLDMPYPITGLGPGAIQNFAEGLLSGMGQFTMIPMATTNDGGTVSGWWTNTQLIAWFQTYSNDDLAAIGGGGIDFADAVDTNASFNLANPKAMSYRVSVSKGEPINFSARFGSTACTPGLAGTTPTGGVSGYPIQFDKISFGGTLSGRAITSITLDVDLGTTPNPELNGTLNPSAMNAGLLTARCSITENGSTASAIADNAGVASFVIAGVTFTMQNLICQNPNQRTQGRGRRVRTFEYTVLGTASARAAVIS
jgi:hypothetical protein